MKYYVNTLPWNQGFYVTTEAGSTKVSMICKGLLTEKSLKDFTNRNKIYKAWQQMAFKFKGMWDE